MVVYKDYETEAYVTWFNQSIQENYDITEEAIADWFVKQNGAKPVMNSYGVNKDNLLSTYIPKLKELIGGYVFFLTYTVAEGGGAGNWINHYAGDTGGSGLECLVDDCNYLLSLNHSYSVALSAPEVAGVAIEDNPGKANEVYKSTPNQSVGQVYMPSTMAGNAWVFCTSWCVAHQGSAPPSVYFNNPYDQIIQAIKDMGGNPFVGGKSYTPKTGTSTSATNTSSQSAVNALRNFADDILKEFEKGMTDRTLDGLKYTNTTVTIDRIFPNMLKASIDEDFINDLVNKYASSVAVYSGSGSPKSGEIGDKVGDFTSTPEKVKNAIDKIRSLNNTRVGSGQCYALSGYYFGLISGKTFDFSISSTYGFPVLPLIGDGNSASQIGTGWNYAGTGWQIVAPTKNNLVIGSICNIKAFNAYFGTGVYGHTGVCTGISGNTVEFTQQNYRPLTISIDNYDIDAFLASVTTIMIPPKD